MFVRRRIGLGGRGAGVCTLSLALWAQAAGCIAVGEWWERTTKRPPAEGSQPYQLADTAGEEFNADQPYDEGINEPPSPEFLEERVQEYVAHFSQGPDQPTGTWQEASAGESPVPNRQADAGSLPPPEQPGEVLVASARDHSTPSEPNGLSALLDDARAKLVETREPAAAPAREQALPVVLLVSVEPDLLWDQGTRKPQAPGGPGEPNRGAEVPVLASPNDIQAIIERLETKVARDPNDLEAQIRLRLLYIASGEDQKASTAPEGLADETATLMQSLAEMIIETRNAAVDLGLGAGQALQAARAFTQHLSRYAQLTIPRVVLSRRVDSYGVYHPIDPPSFAAGSPISAVVYTELQNFHSLPGEQGSFETRLSQRIELLDEQGQRLWQREDTDIVDVSKNRREDFFLAPIIRLPGDLQPGTYHLRVEVQDHHSGKFTSASVPLTILGSGPEQRLSAQQPPQRRLQ